MKTTIDIADGLLEQAKRAAQKDRTTLKSLIEEALRHFLRDRDRKRVRKRLRPVEVHGTTPLSEIANLHQLILDSYDDHAMARLKRSEAH